ncbi:30S ribosomal protein S9 [Candidatus Peregrinibacteria bacterium CG08_land_8_20_14_0_20_41_10]|nr:MAG: 30S ribosomal protein S9 [Candidatus Peregrinibacteria bacterium CG1_02_41_10]PIS32224.1 MAG: 30S ribosomal protein S9 [Candidatus Peregrinibacteria bacterium CG08_land_8_20_14_0_20_41_10]
MVTISSEQEVKPTKLKPYFYACGRRKTASARIRLFPNGSGNLQINDKSGEEYLQKRGALISLVLTPFRLTKTKGLFDVTIKVVGGGMEGQAEAIRHGIALALQKYNENFRPILKKAGLITRDSRIKERKKPGLHGARRAHQWSKR